MAPTAITTAGLEATISVKSQPILVVGSLSSAQDGSYQSLISELTSSGHDVEKQLLDRITDNATILPGSHFSAVYLHLAPSDFIGLSNQLASFLTNMAAALTPQGTLNVSYPPNDYLPTLSAEISGVGFRLQSSSSSSLIAQKSTSPAATSGASVSLRSRRAPLTDEQKAVKKAAIWAVSPASSSTIDAESLLTPEDRVRPIPTCEPLDTSGAVRRKRACKGCTCGLAEFEAEEVARNPVVVLDTAADNDGGAVRTMSKEDREKLRLAALNAGKATSSCGSCFLGDAFRCAGCPYLGLPPFQPGQKVEIDAGMDDI